MRKLIILIILLLSFTVNVSAGSEFDWNWKYEPPTCDYLKVEYPSDLPKEVQGIDVNIRVKNLDTGEIKTLNFHEMDGSQENAGEVYYFEIKERIGWENYEIQWVQVHGTNYHWEGSVVCKTTTTPEPVEPTPIQPTPTEPEKPVEPELPPTGHVNILLLGIIVFMIGLLAFLVDTKKELNRNG